MANIHAVRSILKEAAQARWMVVAHTSSYLDNEASGSAAATIQDETQAREKLEPSLPAHSQATTEAGESAAIDFIALDLSGDVNLYAPLVCTRKVQPRL